MVTRSVILIGPSKAGKTTVSTLLGARLQWPVLQLDDLRWAYYAEIGYDADRAQQLRQEQGFPALVEHWKPYDIHAVERVLADYPHGHVIAFGAGHSVYTNPDDLERAKRALTGHDVILLLPTADIDEANRVLRERLVHDEPELTGDTIPNINRQFLLDPSNAYLATATVYNAGQTPEQTCAAIIELLNHD